MRSMVEGALVGDHDVVEGRGETRFAPTPTRPGA